MDFRQIQYFLSIVETGSFSAAAGEQYISQSSLSKIISSLEKELSVPLFNRSKRKVALTEGGKAFLEHATALSKAYQSMLTGMDGYRSIQDTFSVASIPVLTQYGIAAWLAQFRDLHPEIHFSLEELDGLNILPAVSDRRYDLAFTRHNYLDQEAFESIEVCQDQLLVVVARQNHHAGRASLALSELSNDNFIVFDKVTGMHRLIMEVCGKAGFEPTVFFSSHRKLSVFGLVGTNIGLALMPTRVYEFHRPAEVVAIPLEERIESNIVLAYLKNRQLPPNAYLFIEFIKKMAASSRE